MTTAPRPIRVALGSVPKDSGTFTFYRNLRPALLDRGIELRCITVGAEQRALWETAYADEGCVLLAGRSLDPKRQARSFAAWCAQENIDIVIGLNSEPILSALPHLPERIRVLSRCANGFDHGYRISLSGRDRLARIIALTPRLRDDLITDYGAPSDRVVLIPNGIAAAPFDAAARPRPTGPRLELGFLGRLEHGQKGVLHLPAIVAALKAQDVPFRLRIAGKGRHGPDLRRALAAEIGAGRVDLLGPLAPTEVPGFLGSTDVFLFPSHFEGCPNALLEAMMAGCAPVSWRLPGITDFVLEDGRSGSLVPTGDTAAFAGRIAALARDPAGLAAMQRAAAAEARRRFADHVAADAYAALFQAVMAEPAPPWQPRDWRRFVADPNFPRSWRRRVPPGLRAVGRRVLARLR